MQLKINTAQNVNINYELAGLGPRLLAFMLDFLILMAASFIFLIFVGFTNSFYRSGGVVTFILFFTALQFYHLICEFFFNGKSVGKMILQIQVVRLDGRKTTFWNYLLRWIFRLVDITISLGALAIIFIASTQKMQRIGDLVAGTTVIKVKKPVSLEQLNKYNNIEEHEVTFSQVTLLTDKDFSVIKEAFQEAVRNRDVKLLNSITEKVKEITGISNTHLNNREFLETIIKDYIYLSQNE